MPVCICNLFLCLLFWPRNTGLPFYFTDPSSAPEQMTAENGREGAADQQMKKRSCSDLRTAGLIIPLCRREQPSPTETKENQWKNGKISFFSFRCSILATSLPLFTLPACFIIIFSIPSLCALEKSGERKMRFPRDGNQSPIMAAATKEHEFLITNSLLPRN